MKSKIYVEVLRKCLLSEFETQEKSGVYGYIQRSLAYNSNKIEGSTFTKKQTASMFETGTIFPTDMNEIIKTKDIEEMSGHFKMFNYVLKTIEQPLSQSIIKEMHKCLKEGVFEDMANGYEVGDYKKRANFISDINTSNPSDVENDMNILLKEYHDKNDINIADVAMFHAKFEEIHPFQDGNGRVGRMIIFRECLYNDLIPVIINDNEKLTYMQFLNNAQVNKDYDNLINIFKRFQEDFLSETSSLIFDYCILDEKMKEISNEIEINSNMFEFEEKEELER